MLGQVVFSLGTVVLVVVEVVVLVTEVIVLLVLEVDVELVLEELELVQPLESLVPLGEVPVVQLLESLVPLDDVPVVQLLEAPPLVPLEETDEADYDRLMGINLKGVWLCMREALKIMSPHGAGHIIKHGLGAE